MLQKEKYVLELVLTAEISPQFLSVLVVVKTLLLCLSLEQTILKVLAAMEIMAMDYAHVGASLLQQRTEPVIWSPIMVIDCIRLSVPVDSIQRTL